MCGEGGLVISPSRVKHHLYAVYMFFFTFFDFGDIHVGLYGLAYRNMSQYATSLCDKLYN